MSGTLFQTKGDTKMIYRRLFGLPTSRLRSPFEQLESMRQQMDRWYEDMSSSPFQNAMAGVFPLINLSEDKDSYYLRAELPGVKSEELDIQVTGGTISISGERKIAAEAENVKYHRREREAEKFSRAFTLPSDIDNTKVEADLKDGILTVTIPKAEATKPKQITVKS
jgi:HSP20 family protein